MSDIDIIRKWFKTHKFLTVEQAIHKLGVYNLRSRVSEMTDVARDHFRAVTKRDGKAARVAVYASI